MGIFAVWKLKKKRDQEGLIWLLKNNANVARALGEIGDDKAVMPLISALKDDGLRTVKMWAAWALGEIGDARAINPLIAALNDTESEVRFYASAALCKMSHLAAKPLIAELKKNGDWNVRRRVAEVLGTDRVIKSNFFATYPTKCRPVWAEDSQIIEALILAMKDKQCNVRETAAKVLKKIGWKPSNQSEQVTYLIALDKFGKLIKIGQPAVEPLIAILTDRSYCLKKPHCACCFTRSSVAYILGEIGGDKAVDPLIITLKSEESWKVEVAIAETLGKIGNPKAIPQLIPLLNDRWYKGVRITAVQEAAINALRKTTGKNFGKDTAKWRDWWINHKFRSPRSSGKNQ